VSSRLCPFFFFPFFFPVAGRKAAPPPFFSRGGVGASPMKALFFPGLTGDSACLGFFPLSERNGRQTLFHDSLFPPPFFFFFARAGLVEVMSSFIFCFFFSPDVRRRAEGTSSSFFPGTGSSGPRFSFSFLPGVIEPGRNRAFFLFFRVGFSGSSPGCFPFFRTSGQHLHPRASFPLLAVSPEMQFFFHPSSLERDDRV